MYRSTDSNFGCFQVATCCSIYTVCQSQVMSRKCLLSFDPRHSQLSLSCLLPTLGQDSCSACWMVAVTVGTTPAMRHWPGSVCQRGDNLPWSVCQAIYHLTLFKSWCQSARHSWQHTCCLHLNIKQHLNIAFYEITVKSSQRAQWRMYKPNLNLMRHSEQ